MDFRVGALGFRVQAGSNARALLHNMRFRGML